MQHMDLSKLHLSAVAIIGHIVYNYYVTGMKQDQSFCLIPLTGMLKLTSVLQACKLVHYI